MSPEGVTFQVTVVRFALSSPLLKDEDVRATVSVGDISKITCSGDVSQDGLVVTWNHPFLFFAPPSTIIEVSLCILPKELSNEWEKQSLGDCITTDVASLLESANTCKFDILGLPNVSATLSLRCKANDVLVAHDGHDCLLALTTDNKNLYNFLAKFQNTACVITNIEVDLARLDLCPFGHAGHTIVLSDLAISLSLCYDQLGNVSALHKAVDLMARVLYLCPLGHPKHAQALGGLIIVLSKSFKIQRKKVDLDCLILLQQRWLELCPPGHPDHVRALGVLANSLWEQYYMQGESVDLDRAIEMGEQSLNLCSEDHIDYNSFLNNLALLVNARYREQGNLSDLSRAIQLQEEYLELCPPGHQSHGVALQNLAISLQDQYDETKNQADLIRAMELFKEALNTHPTYHGVFACCATQLADTFLLLSSQKHNPSDHPLASLDDAFKTYQLLKECGSAVSLDLLEAIEDWVRNAEEYNHPSVLEAYQTLLNTLDHFTSLTGSLHLKHETMPMRVANQANNAFSCASRHSDFPLAVELLEQGRGIMWNQLARFDFSVLALEDLGNQEQELRRRFIQLSADLRKHAEESAGGTTEPLWQVQEEWQSVVDKIRQLDGFSQFLLPPCFEDLQRAAERGPVIIVNATKYTCNALIILRSRAPVHVPLPCSLADVEQLCSQLLELTRDPHAYGDHRESWIKETLRDLWSLAVEPIASVLQHEIELPPGSRVWWCPTSKFTALPLHAAGPHRKTEKNFFDIYVSSYALSLSSLLRAQDRIRSQRAAREASGTAHPISFAAVGQGRPSTDTHLGELPEVEHEIRRIRDETGMSPNVEFDVVSGGAATIEGAVQTFRDHRWVHVACHGAQNAEQPFESWFAMGDGKLTLLRIIQERYMNSEFAFLSACHTAVGDASMPDEVLHLAAGMQFAGFNGVIGTLWRVDDAVAHQVVTRFYKEMFRQPVIGFEHAAAALNTAVVETADEVSLEKRIVFVHIGI